MPELPEVATMRRAAVLLRGRAAAATGEHWHATRDGVYVGGVRIASTDERIGEPAHNSAHMAALDPATALLLADWLDHAVKDEATYVDPPEPGDGGWLVLQFCRSYLGEALGEASDA